MQDAENFPSGVLGFGPLCGSRQDCVLVEWNDCAACRRITCERTKMECGCWELRCSESERGGMNGQLVAMGIVELLCTKMIVTLGASELHMMYT
jgi:hypothetical protein